jgi:hypothetical protein
VFGIPGFGPGTNAPFQIGDNPVGNTGINVLAVGLGIEVCHDLLLEAGVAALRCAPASRRVAGVQVAGEIDAEWCGRRARSDRDTVGVDFF